MGFGDLKFRAFQAYVFFFSKDQTKAIVHSSLMTPMIMTMMVTALMMMMTMTGKI